MRGKNAIFLTRAKRSQIKVSVPHSSSPLGRPPSRPYTGSRRHLVCHHTFVCVSYRVDGHLVILMAGEARHEAWVGPRSDWPSSDRPSSDAHPRRGFQGHRHSFPTARACAAPPAPAGAPKDTATHSSNTHEQHTTTHAQHTTTHEQHTTTHAQHTTTTHNNSTQQREQAQLPALLCNQAQRTPGQEPPTKCHAQVTSARHLTLSACAVPAACACAGGGSETCVSRSIQSTMPKY